MTSGHANVAYGSAHSSHSSTISHSNSADSVGLLDDINHSLSFVGGSSTFPRNECEGSLSILYEKSEAIRNQFNSYSKKNSSSLLPTKPEKITLGDAGVTSSLLYKLYSNAYNQGSGQYLAPKYKWSVTSKIGTNYKSGSSHTNHTNTSSVNMTGIREATDNYTFDCTLGSNETYYLYDGSHYVTLTGTEEVFNTGSILSETGVSGTAGTKATKATMSSLLDVLNKYTVSNSIVDYSDMGTFSFNNYRSGHSNHSNYSDDYSKREYKNNIEDYNESALNKINEVNVVRFNYKPEINDPTIDRVGFIADDTDEIFSTHYHDRMDYMNCIGMLIKGVQELSNKVDVLQEKLNKQEQKLKEFSLNENK